MITRLRLVILIGVCGILLSACRPETPVALPVKTAPPVSESTGAQSKTTTSPDSVSTLESLNEVNSGELVLGYTYQRADGNRLASGAGSVPFAQVVDLPLEGKPLWVAAVPAEEGSLWAAVLEDGRVQAFHVHAPDRVEPVSVIP